MKKTILYIVLFAIAINFSFLQGQEIRMSKVEVLRAQISELTKKRNFIEESACPQDTAILKEYQANFDRLLDISNIAIVVYETPLTIEKDRVKEQGEKFVNYQSTNLSNVIVKRYSSQISMAGIVSDNSSITVGTKLLRETFTLKGKEISALYRVTQKHITLLNMEAIYTDKTRIFLDVSHLPQAELNVYNTTEYGSEFNNLSVLFSNEIGQLNLIKTTGYALVPERYTEWLKDTPNQGLIKYRYAIYCEDENGDRITPTQKGNDIEIKPSTYLLWYNGTIGKYPIKMMLKSGLDKESKEDRISEVVYGYDSKKEWINLQDLTEPQDGINGFERDKQIATYRLAEWSVPFEYNTILKGDWDNLNGKTLPVTLTPMAKEFPTFTFKAQIKEDISPNGSVANQSVISLRIYDDKNETQTIKFENPEDLENFNIGYVDINYDGYLDLIVNYNFYLYNPISNKFDLPDGEWDYIPNLTQISAYNVYTKSFILQTSRTFLEYRSVNGKIIPYMSDSYYPDADGNMVVTKQKYSNGKWKVIEESIQKIDEDDDYDNEDSIDDDIDIASPKNYDLNADLEIDKGSLVFSPLFYNKTEHELKINKAQLYVEMKDAQGKIHKQFLYNTTLNDGELLDDNYILNNGKDYFLTGVSKLIPFFPLNLKNGTYTFRLKLEHPLFGKVYSKNQKLTLPLALKKDTSIEHFIGSIGNSVKGAIYFTIDDKKVKGTFINAKTDQRVQLKGSLEGEKLHLKEYEKDEILSGYFEGDYTNNIYKGFWISPDRKTKVPFEFIKQ